MSISPITNTGGTTSTDSSSGLKADSNTFMKLLVANLQHQDPMQPQDSSAYMQQLSQMTMVEQLTSLATSTKTTAESQQAAAAVTLLGKTVSYIGADGNPVTGTVERVDVAGERPTLTVSGIPDIDAGLVTEVA